MIVFCHMKLRVYYLLDDILQMITNWSYFRPHLFSRDGILTGGSIEVGPCYYRKFLDKVRSGRGSSELKDHYLRYSSR